MSRDARFIYRRARDFTRSLIEIFVPESVCTLSLSLSVYAWLRYLRVYLHQTHTRRISPPASVCVCVRQSCGTNSLSTLSLLRERVSRPPPYKYRKCHVLARIDRIFNPPPPPPIVGAKSHTASSASAVADFPINS